MKKIIYLFIASVFIFTSCNQDEEIIDLSSQSKPNIKKNHKVTICHYDEDTGEYHTINVSENAVQAHLAHGDILGDCDDIITICFNDETIRVDKHTLENYVPFTFGNCETGPEPGEEYTYVPDDNFEQYLIQRGWDDELDNIVLTSNIESLTFLYVKSLNIDDLTGIEDFVELIQLNCSNNNLKKLNLSSNSKLKIVDCASNQLESLNIINSPDISRLNCDHNQLTNLDISNKPSLSSLTCNNNLISSINLTNSNNIISLVCYSNELTSLDVTNNSNLKTLKIYKNQIIDLDLSNNPVLNYLACFNNYKLERLNVQNGNNENLKIYPGNIYNKNPITCFQVDSATYSTANWTTAYTYTENCY